MQTQCQTGVGPGVRIHLQGSGGAYAQAAARALTQHTNLSAEDVVRQSLQIAGEICIYTNMNHTIEVL